MISNSRQSLVKGERLVRHDMRPVLINAAAARIAWRPSMNRDGRKLNTGPLVWGLEGSTITVAILAQGTRKVMRSRSLPFWCVRNLELEGLEVASLGGGG